MHISFIFFLETVMADSKFSGFLQCQKVIYFLLCALDYVTLILSLSVKE